MSFSRKIRSSYTLKNKVTLISGGGPFFSTMKDMIINARHSIQLQVYIFEADQTGSDIANLLIEAALSGKKVQVLLDGYASRNIPATLVAGMRSAGIRLRFFEPLFRSKHFYFGRRMHHKILVCDGTVAMVGGINISDRYNDLPGSPAWLDWAVKIEGEAALELQKICNRLHAKRDDEWIDNDASVESILNNIEPNCPVRIRRNDWVKNLNQISATYMEMLRKANQEIIIMSSYFIPSSFFRHQMMHALKKGVKIKLILAGRSDVGMAKHAERFLYQWALRNKIEIHEYRHNILHGKIAVCDSSRVTLGSYNVNDISAKASLELNVDIDEVHFAQEVEQALSNIIATQCNQVLPTRKGMSLLEQLTNWVSYEIYKTVFTLFTFYFRREKADRTP